MSGLDVQTLIVGPVGENTYIVRPDGSERALLIDPGDEAERLIAAIAQLGVAIDAILVTHTHFDHVGAVAPLARHTGAPVYCPALERHILADINTYMRMTGFGPFEGYEAEELLSGGEHLDLAGLEIDVHFTPGHSPGHLTYAIPAHAAIFSGDVLFAGSVGRVDLPGGDWSTLLASIGALLDAYPDDTRVYAGHMSLTTLGQERAHNPFLAELRVSAGG
ncbi:MAG: MBL fold metallo-hydrolase [Solirubrobacteraceae bacterium]|jgi:glyoxylase-like metal-dependent hydrolase (beta-lactamase superfamily II)